jgi:hypothetical protein
MSAITISDKRGGTYQAVIEFTYGECERLPFNILRRIHARIATVPNGGVLATATFNIRTPEGSAAFLEMLDLFGEDGSYVHGSAAHPADVSRIEPPAGIAEDDDLEVEGMLEDNG